jgi:hypothetical protein
MLSDVMHFLPLFVLLAAYVWWATARQKISVELQRTMQDLARESIRVQTEANQLMRELVDALRGRP